MSPLDKFSTAEKYFRKWIGRLGASPTAMKEDDHQLDRHRIAIKTIMRKHNCEERVRDYMTTPFGKASTNDLNPAELKQVYNYAHGLKHTVTRAAERRLATEP